MSDILDITYEKQTGLDLMVRINELVKETQSVLLRTLPSVILMTQAQYDKLSTIDGSMPEMFNSTERFYITPHNVMEVSVKNPTKKTWKQAIKEKD